MEGRMTTTSICNPHICMGNWGVLWGYCGVLWLLQGIGGTVGYWGVRGYLGVNRVVVDTLGYVVLSGYCMVLLITAGYFWVLVVLRCIEVHWGVTRGTLEYCGVLQGTAGHCWVLPGTAWYYWLLGATRCILVQGGVLGVHWDTARYCGYWGVLC